MYFNVYYIVLYILTVGILLVATVLNLGIIHYERSLPSPRRTLINLLLAHQSRLTIIQVCLAHSTIVLTGIFGHLDDGFFCNSVAVLVISISLAMFLIGNTIMILRYFFICHFKNVAVIQDEFLTLFTLVVSALLPAYSSGLIFFTGAQRIPFFHYCAGNDAVGQLLGEDNLWHQKIATFASIMCFTVVFVKTRAYEKNMDSVTSLYANISLQESKGSLVNGATMVKTVFVWQLFYIGGGTVFKTGTEGLRLPFLMVAPVFAIWQTFTFAVLLPLAYYWNDKEMRRKVAKMAKGKFKEYLHVGK